MFESCRAHGLTTPFFEALCSLLCVDSCLVRFLRSEPVRRRRAQQKRRLPAPLLKHEEVFYLLPQTDELFSPVW